MRKVQDAEGEPNVAVGWRPRAVMTGSPGMEGRFAVELVATFVWNRWQLCCGISGKFAVEYAFGWGGAFPARANGIDPTGIERHDRFEAEVTDPVIDKVVEVAEALPLDGGVASRVARVGIEARPAQTGAAVFLAVDTEGMQVLVAPGKDDLHRSMEGSQRHVAVDKELTPDQRTNAVHDHADLVGMGWDR
jgi:hypothetical protein